MNFAIREGTKPKRIFICELIFFRIIPNYTESARLNVIAIMNTQTKNLAVCLPRTHLSYDTAFLRS